MANGVSRAGRPVSDEFVKGLWRDSPTLVQVLGMCPTLAVSNSVRNALAMGIATTFVLVASNVAISMLRKFIPNEVRIGSFILVIATFVTMVDYAIQAISLELYKALGAFIALIVVNCIILGRAEAFASKNSVGRSALDGLGNGLGFCFSLFVLGTVREILGSGSFLGHELFHEGYQDWVVMVLPSGGFFTLAAWMMVYKAINRRRAARAVLAAEGAR
jgi:electron transport complex protein RnfE